MREALETVAQADAVEQLLAAALRAAGRGAIPEDPGPFATFVEGALRTIVEQSLGAQSYEIVAERLGHVMLMASSTVRSIPGAHEPPKTPPAPPSQDRGNGDELWEEDSAVRLSASPRHEPTVPLTLDLDELPLPAEVRDLPPSPRVPRETVTLGRMVVPRPVRRDTAIHEESGPPGRRDLDPRSPSTPSNDTLRPPSVPLAEVLLVTLDPSLVSDTSTRMRNRSRAVAIGTIGELLSAIRGARSSLAIVIDTALPSIDLPTVASVASSFPPDCIVILWGMSERQKARLATMFPIAQRWVAGGVAGSVAELLLASD